MSRERDAIELIWKVLEDQKKQFFSFEWPGTGEAKIEQILTQMEDLIQEDLEQMERSSSRSREIPKVCPLLEEYKKSREATNTQRFWDEAEKVHHITEALLQRAIERQENTAEGEGYSPI